MYVCVTDTHSHTPTLISTHTTAIDMHTQGNKVKDNITLTGLSISLCRDVVDCDCV